MARFEQHIFVCEHERPAENARGCCAAKGSENVRLKFKQLISKSGLKGLVRANRAGCLNQCGLGVTVVVYPDQVWYQGVTLEDVDEIFERHIEQGQVVERLRIPDELLNTREAMGLGEQPGSSGP